MDEAMKLDTHTPNKYSKPADPQQKAMLQGPQAKRIVEAWLKTIVEYKCKPVLVEVQFCCVTP